MLLVNTHNVHFEFSLARALYSGGAKCCDKRVCVAVCVYVCQSVREHISRTSCSGFVTISGSNFRCGKTPIILFLWTIDPTSTGEDRDTARRSTCPIPVASYLTSTANQKNCSVRSPTGRNTAYITCYPLQENRPSLICQQTAAPICKD